MNFNEAWVKYCAIMDSRDLCSELASAVSRSATSFWNVKVNGTLPRLQALLRSEIFASHRVTRGVEMLKGKFPIKWIFGSGPSHGVCKSCGKILLISNDNTSPQNTLIFPGQAFSSIFILVSKRLSFSINTTCLGPRSKIDRVIPPGPGPTSQTRQLETSPAAFTILLVNFWSSKKFCDSCFIAVNWYNLIKSRTLGSGGRRCRRSSINNFDVLVAISNAINLEFKPN